MQVFRLLDRLYEGLVTQQLAGQLASEALKGSAGRFDRQFNVGVRMCCAEKCGFELRRRQIDSVLQHPAMELCEGFGIGSARIVVVPDFAILKKPREHRAYA